MSNMTFGQWLTQKREALGLNQTELANLANVSKNYISLLERDAPAPNSSTPIQPRKKQLEKIAKALRVSSKEIMEAAGYAVPKQESKETNGHSPNNEEIKELAERLAHNVMASGYHDLKDPELREAFLADMETIAESMLKRKLEEQRKRKKR